MRHRSARRLVATLAPALALLAWPAAADLTASLSQQSIQAGEPVVLTLTQTGAADMPPDLAPLEDDFQILGRSTSTQVRVVNGRRSEHRDVRLRLLPRRSGTLSIPAIQLGADSTQPLRLRVEAPASTASPSLAAPASRSPSEASAPPPVDVDVVAETRPRQARVAQQVLLIVRVIAEAPPRGRLHDAPIDGARVLPLGEERRSEETAEGELHVYERRYALFPTRPGQLEIPPIRFDAWATGAGEASASRSEALTLEVLPIPNVPDDRQWLPARSVTLSEAGPSAVQLAPGQALERTIVLQADGVMAEDLLEIPLAIPFQFRIRDDPPRLWNEPHPEGVTGYRTERILISAAEPGRYRLSSPGLHWWNTQTGRWARAELPDWTLTVAPLDSSARRLAPAWQAPGAEPVAPPAIPMNEPDATPAEPLWRRLSGTWLAILAGLLLVAVLLWLWYRRRRSMPPPGYASAYAPRPAAPSDADAVSAGAGRDAMTDAIAEVDAAYRAGNPNRAHSALLAWAALVWPDDAPANLARLALRVPEPLSGRIKLLEKAFFSPTPVDWASAAVAPLLAEHAASEPAAHA